MMIPSLLINYGNKPSAFVFSHQTTKKNSRVTLQDMTEETIEDGSRVTNLLLAITTCIRTRNLPLGFIIQKHLVYKREYDRATPLDRVSFDSNERAVLDNGWTHSSECTTDVYPRKEKDVSLDGQNTWMSLAVCNRWFKKGHQCLEFTTVGFTGDVTDS